MAEVANRPTIEIWENTYQMTPKKEESFLPHVARAIIKSVMEDKLKDVSWDEKAAKTLAAELCSLIKDKVKGQSSLH